MRVIGGLIVLGLFMLILRSLFGDGAAVPIIVGIFIISALWGFLKGS
jgi:hypothetical protein